MNHCARRSQERSLQELLRNPHAGKIIDSIVSDMLAKFAISAFQNRPEEIPEGDWKKIVGLVLTAGYKGTDAEIVEVPKDDAAA